MRKLLNIRLLGVGITIALLQAPFSWALPGYSYELIDAGANYGNTQFITIPYQFGAINNNGDVVYVVRTSSFDNPTLYEVMLKRSGQPAEVAITLPSTNEFFEGAQFDAGGENKPLGITDAGVISVGARWNTYDVNDQLIDTERGYVLVDTLNDTITEIRVDLRRTSGRATAAGQLSGRPGPVVGISEVWLTDGVTTLSSPASPGNVTTVQNNDNGQIAFLGFSDSGDTLVNVGTAGQSLTSVNIGPFDGEGHTEQAGIGVDLNNGGWASIYTQKDFFVFDFNARVMIIEPTSQNVFSIAQTDGTSFLNFRQPQGMANFGVPINAFNRVAFNAEVDTGDSSVTTTELFVADRSDDSPRPVFSTRRDENGAVERLTFTNGQYTDGPLLGGDIVGFGLSSMNDAGQILLLTNGSLFDADGSLFGSSNRRLVIVAHPVAGAEPGTPVQADASDTLSEGVRLRGRCWREDIDSITGSCDELGGVSGPTPRAFYRVLPGAEYTVQVDTASVGAFSSILIPDSPGISNAQLTIEADGISTSIVPGTVFDFAQLNVGAVRAFTLVATEPGNRSSATPIIEILGLTFSEGSDEDVSFVALNTLTPLDSDADGISDGIDNCTNASNASQLDADSDGYGNICDADFNNDCTINFLDISMFSNEFLGNNAIFDLNGDGVVNFLDFAGVANAFLQAPGPGAGECP